MVLAISIFSSDPTVPITSHPKFLAAISNDPMGQEFEKVTKEINQDSSLKIANIAIETGCKSFVFASSCSVYGIGNDFPRNENDPVNPLTAYAKSKVGTEESLKKIKNLKNTSLTCLRFATACGFSPNLRLDLVLNAPENFLDQSILDDFHQQILKRAKDFGLDDLDANVSVIPNRVYKFGNEKIS